MSAQAQVVVFDVNETLSDMAPLAQRFADVGAPAHLAKTWFAAVLRDGFALAAAGASARFADIAGSVLRGMLTQEGVADPDAGVAHVLEGFGELDVHDDVPDGVRALHRSGLRLITLTNGAVSITEKLLTRAQIRADFERLLSVDDAGIWKPARGSYDYAVRQCAVLPEQMVLVAVHPWDVDGAHRAGLQTAWINRSGSDYPKHLTQPDLTVTSLRELPERLA